MEPIKAIWDKYGALFQLVGFIVMVASLIYAWARTARDGKTTQKAYEQHIEKSTEAIKTLTEELKRFIDETARRDREHREEILEMYKKYFQVQRARKARR